MPEQTTPAPEGQGVETEEPKLTIRQLQERGFFVRGYVAVDAKLYLYLYTRWKGEIVESRKLVRKDGVVFLKHYLLSEDVDAVEWIDVVRPCSLEYPAEVEVHDEDAKWLFYWDGKVWNVVRIA